MDTLFLVKSKLWKEMENNIPKLFFFTISKKLKKSINFPFLYVVKEMTLNRKQSKHSYNNLALSSSPLRLKQYISMTFQDLE